MDEQRNEYRTGRTEPRRKHNGIIALLLILVIFLSGLVSVLGIMNIRLFHLLDKKKESAPLSFSRQEELLPTQTEDAVIFSGMTIQEIPAVYQSVHALPAGLYIAHIREGSAAQLAGILAGDVLETFAGTQVTTLETLKNLLSNAQGSVTLTVCRDGQHQQITLEVSRQ